MSNAALPVALLALAAAGYALYQEHEREDAACAARTQAADTAARLDALERELGALRRVAPEPSSLSASPAPEEPAAGAASAPASTGPGLAGSPRTARTAPPSPEGRVAALEQEVARLKEAESERTKNGRGPTFFTSGPAFHDVESAARALNLDPGQKSDLERIVEEAKRRLEDLSGVPNDEGVTGRSLADALRRPLEEGQDLSVVMTENMAKNARWRASKVPGTNETYGQAEQRIRKESKDRARRLLSAEQAKTWDRSPSDLLFAQGGTGMGLGATVMVVGDAAAVEVRADTPPAPSR